MSPTPAGTEPIDLADSIDVAATAPPRGTGTPAGEAGLGLSMLGTPDAVQCGGEEFCGVPAP